MHLKRFNEDESQSEILDRICDKGIVVEPWALVALADPGRVRLDTCEVTGASSCESSYLPGHRGPAPRRMV